MGDEKVTKTFADCTTDEKLDRIAQVLRGVRQAQAYQQGLEYKVNALNNHQHGTDGRVLVPLAPSGLGGTVSSGMALKSNFDPLA